MRPKSLALATAMLAFVSCARAHETQLLLPTGLGSVRRPADHAVETGGYGLVTMLGASRDPNPHNLMGA